MLDFVILDTDFAHNEYSLRLRNYSVNALSYAIVFFEKNFCY